MKQTSTKSSQAVVVPFRVNCWSSHIYYLLTRVATISLILISLGNVVSAQSAKPTWIWYPGDFEIWLSNQMQSKRTERNAFIPPFWRVYGHQIIVNFSKNYNLDKPEEIVAKVEGKYNVTIDGKYVQTGIEHITLPAGKHKVNFQVYNQVSPPSIYVAGEAINSDSSWTVEIVHNNSSENLPGKGKNGFAGSWNFNSPGTPPSQYKLSTKEIKVVDTKQGEHSVLVDFGEETIGFVKLKNLTGKGKVSFYYGESKAEALSIDSCELLDHFDVNGSGADFISDQSRALRYVNIHFEEGVKFDDVSLIYEYLPIAHRGQFKSSDPELNKIWNVAERTLELNTREFFVDGIKRDHWVWSGDAVQSYLMNYYSFFDNETVKRTTWALRGGEPVESHINTILDYSLYWFTGIYDYYQYTGDENFLKSIYPRMVTQMDFVLKRRDNNGMLAGLPGDWVFLDWAPMTKEGELSAIQILFARSLESMTACARLMNDGKNADLYNKLAIELKAKIMNAFWDKDKQAFIHNRTDDKLNTQVTRYPNMFAVLFGYLDPSKVEAIKNNVLMNNSVQKITTPYMRFYELAALAEIGEQKYVTKEIKSYWGGMLREGATTFWEQYNPGEKGAARYAMYGRPYGRSLCHAWGASPLYLLGKYYLGVKPLQPGYSEYLIEPALGGLQWIEGKVPTPDGEIAVSVTRSLIKIKTAGGKGTLRLKSIKVPKCKSGSIKRVESNIYEMPLEKEKEYSILYTALND
ncbi:alpha-L-rhamnosidase-related protein [Mucilaginibacter lappiensis]|uniref:Alpha-L-rhamnosidase n=1 Tax=Mucilaginibacter lappiensis TaxID=354630 RepID=A0A841JPE6_9SPHI|nr:alpha-L-rhamnosidase C-terminal domain-containing protein [Mucilaginibacter lappiensis]MBB6130628.1 hypothetical protein [Mucilaginibacter lappiensis]